MNIKLQGPPVLILMLDLAISTLLIPWQESDRVGQVLQLNMFPREQAQIPLEIGNVRLGKGLKTFPGKT